MLNLNLGFELLTMQLLLQCDDPRLLFSFKIILKRSEEVTNNRDTPGATQNLLPLHAAHVVDVGVVFGETKDPAEWSRPEPVS